MFKHLHMEKQTVQAEKVYYFGFSRKKDYIYYNWDYAFRLLRQLKREVVTFYLVKLMAWNLAKIEEKIRIKTNQTFLGISIKYISIFC